MHFRKPGTVADSSEKTNSSRRRKRTRRQETFREPTLSQADLELLPEKDYAYYDALEDKELLAEARKYNIPVNGMARSEIVEALMKEANKEKGAEYRTGVLEIMPDGWGFLRQKNYSPSPEDVYVSQSQIRRFMLRMGDVIFGQVRPPKEGEKYYGLLRVESINGYAIDSEVIRTRPDFDKLTPIFPDKRIRLETDPNNIAARIIDLICPIGKGQRGLIVSPPKAGKTTLLKTIAKSVEINHPEIYIMVLLVDERPEEVTDMRRWVKGQVISSTFDEPPENHMRVSELCLQQARRLVEVKKDVIVLLDSITRMSRASNLTVTPSGRTLSGGLDPAAMYRPRRFFGSARNIEEGGSLTIIATALIDTGSKMDDAIFEEFKGTGNMELVLDRDLAERRIWPAIDVKRSSTRAEEKLFNPEELESIYQLHRLLANQQDNVEATESLIKLLKRTSSNSEFLSSIVQKMRGM
ncbi:MAG TPA: transcription termination factor Rho [Fimbriimonadales bacterium]|nr:transcription termination factor Rho [Fimbriimonadales bacterium]